MCNKFVYLCLCIITISASVVFVIGQKNEKQLESSLPCSADSDCVENSICIGNTVDSLGLCTCKKDFIPRKNKTFYACLPELKNFTTDSCKEDIQCQVAFTNYAECKQNKCVCKQGSHFYSTGCYETVKLNEICTFQQSCLLKTGKIAGCVEGRCQCGFPFHPVSGPDGEICEIVKLLSQDCTDDNQCIVANSRCYGTCRCQLGYATSSDYSMCLKEADKLFDSCQEDSQCEPISILAVCDQFRCGCTTHTHSHKGSCYKNKKLNSTCESLAECLLFPELEEYVDCRDGICTCKGKFTENGQRCTNKAVIKIPQQCSVLVIAAIFLYLKSL